MMNKSKHVLVWIAICLSLILIGSAVVIVMLHHTPAQPPADTVPQTTTTQPPEENTLTPLDFGYVDGYLTCLTQDSIMGVDVSSYQREIDWQKVKDAGFEFVILRAGFRGYGASGVLKEDSYAQINYQNAKAAGLKVGAYFFSQAITEEEAIDEAQYLLEITKDWELDMPLAFDWECLADDYRTVDVTPRQLTDFAKAFCETVKGAGRRAMVYFNPNQSRKDMYLAELQDYGFWLAMYTEKMTYDYNVNIWQYTRTGSVPGIAGNVDINLYFPNA